MLDFSVLNEISLIQFILVFFFSSWDF